MMTAARTLNNQMHWVENYMTEELGIDTSSAFDGGFSFSGGGGGGGGRSW